MREGKRNAITRIFRSSDSVDSGDTGASVENNSDADQLEQVVDFNERGWSTNSQAIINNLTQRGFIFAKAREDNQFAPYMIVPYGDRHVYRIEPSNRRKNTVSDVDAFLCSEAGLYVDSNEIRTLRSIVTTHAVKHGSARRTRTVASL